MGKRYLREMDSQELGKIFDSCCGIRDNAHNLAVDLTNLYVEELLSGAKAQFCTYEVGCYSYYQEFRFFWNRSSKSGKMAFEYVKSLAEYQGIFPVSFVKTFPDIAASIRDFFWNSDLTEEEEEALSNKITKFFEAAGGYIIKHFREEYGRYDDLETLRLFFIEMVGSEFYNDAFIENGNYAKVMETVVREVS